MRNTISLQKSYHLCSFLHIHIYIYIYIYIYRANYDNSNQYIENKNRIEHLLSKVNTKSCVYKMDELFAENDIIHVTSYRELPKSFVLKVNINGNLEDYLIFATYFLKKIAIKNLKNGINFSLIKSPFELTPKKLV